MARAIRFSGCRSRRSNGRSVTTCPPPITIPLRRVRLVAASASAPYFSATDGFTKTGPLAVAQTLTGLRGNKGLAPSIVRWVSYNRPRARRDQPVHPHHSHVLVRQHHFGRDVLERRVGLAPKPLCLELLLHEALEVVRYLIAAAGPVQVDDQPPSGN